MDFLKMRVSPAGVGWRILVQPFEFGNCNTKYVWMNVLCIHEGQWGGRNLVESGLKWNTLFSAFCI